MSLRKTLLCSSSAATTLATVSRRTALSGDDAQTSQSAESKGDDNQARGGGEDEGSWSRMLPELLSLIIQNLESSQQGWPLRRDVVACACVCKRWREVTKQIVKPPTDTGRLTFLSSLKEAGPRDYPIHCFIKRNKRTSTFNLYLGLNHSSMENVKFLLAARRFRRGAHTEYIISLDADDMSQGSAACVGKLSSDFLGTKFTIYDSQPPHAGAKSSTNASRRLACNQVSPQVAGGSFKVGQILYKFNVLKSRGPRRMLCTVQCPCSEEAFAGELHGNLLPSFEHACLKNKTPRWHEHLQCWCLNFHGRVTVASVKNFQLVATIDPSRSGCIGDEESVLLQFGKVGNNVFTMDYREPLSAFLAFAICLTSFGTKFACE